MEIRPAEPEDLEALVRVFRAAGAAAWTHILAVDTLASNEPTALAERLDNTLVGEKDGEVVGFATVGDGELYMLYTDPRVWGKGFGRALMDAALAELASRGFDEATLWTEERNERPRWIYERYGWKQDGTVREREYRGTRLRELRYRIPIAARPDIGEVARRELGFDALRPGQEEAVRAVLDGHDTLAVMPTGSGKSAIYELATRIGGGPTVVVSPLLALQRDQVESLAAHGEAAAELNSTLSAGAQEERLEELVADELAFLFLAPEQLAREDTLAGLAAARPHLFVVDEAHCISEWGHDFRPDYLRLGSVVSELGGPTILALTATASPPVRAEIVERLGMNDARVVVRGFDRPNIHLAVESFHDAESKLEALVERVAELPKPGIVYAATRRHAETVADRLLTRGMTAHAYHAGLHKSEREETQTAFKDDELDVVVATIAFGMGVDKPNVRFVAHSEISDSIDAYYQEIGRAGRDGAPARAILFYRPEDLGLRRFFAGAGHVRVDEVLEVAADVASARGPVDPRRVRDRTGLSETKVTAALGRLEQAGAVEVLANGDVAVAHADVDFEQAAQEAVEQQERHREFERSRVDMIRAYAEAEPTACRREFVLNYFGERYEPPCGNCDNCDSGRVRPRVGDEPFPLGARVAHAKWGEGDVERYEADKMVVLFDEVGYKTLAVELVRERGLLTMRS